MDSILFIKTSSLGDVVHHMPAVTDARQRFPDAQIVWVVEEAFAPLVGLHPAVDAVIPVATRRWRKQFLKRETWREIRAFRARLRPAIFNRVIDAQGLIRSAILARAAQGQRHGYDAQSIKEPLASRFYDVRHRVSRALHAVERNRKLTGLSLGYQPTAAIDYGLIGAAKSSDRYAMLLHGTSRVAKEWPEECWIELGRWLHGKGFECVLPWGDGVEKLRAERLCAAIPDSRVLERQPLDATAKVIAAASLVVGVDTGLLHLAAAYQVPLAGIYVSSDPGLTGPVGAGRIVIVTGVERAPVASEVIAGVEQLL
ncbi:lipopolysaccharide heptosyltransferase I [Bradyrhizobium sp. LHD-71]|uniref:lipopolysaccharide heptosyltransferase I n=1 Tax=Bradyrhizobium sp. LHD-71 TaxID=3072141 RepID=UPI00280D2FA1|nr:lipopolysaccharide heptosyltransferase I [Bradyrhizobium sp. LHD-71]MDQ8728431.1 lipopolysaccharide heptosyltransferase I [Bradyrhizobium sp. LHD-71]